MDKSANLGSDRLLLHGALLTLTIGAHSGCAMFQGSRQVTRNPEDPGHETIITKRCSPPVYPFMFTGACFDAGAKATGACLGISLCLDAISLPFVLPAALFASECSTQTVTKEIPGYHKQDGRPANILLEGLSFTDPGREGLLRGGDTGQISFILKNGAAAGRAEDLEAAISAYPSGGLIFNPIKKIGTLGPGDSQSVKIDIKTTDALRDGQATLTISFREAGRNPPDPVQIKINTNALRPPHLKIARIAMDDGSPTGRGHLALGNGNGILNPGESVELAITLANIGTGPADALAVALVGDDGSDLHVLESDRFQRKYSIGRLRANESGRVTFAISVSRLYRGPAEIPLTLQVSERRGRFNARIPLGIRIGQRMPRTELLTIQPWAVVSETPATMAANEDCMPRFYLSLPRDSVWFYGAGSGTTVAEARQKALDALALQAGGTEAVSGWEQDDSKVCAGTAFILVRVEKAAAGSRVVRIPGR